MTNQEIELKITELVKGIVFSDVSKSQELLTTNLLDSIGIVDLVVQIEDQLGVHFDLQEVNETTFNSVEKITAQIEQKLRTSEN